MSISLSSRDLPELARRTCPSCLAVFRQAIACCPRDGHALVEQTVDPLVGSTLVNRFRILECIGEGGMGRVYRAQHASLPKLFAIKVLFGDFAADQTMQARFRAEAAATARMNHPNIAAIADFGETETGLLYLAMELATGSSLAEHIHEFGPLSGSRVGEILLEIAAGLDHAHRRGLIHRDLKTENILLSGDGDVEQIKIVDFGIALVLDSEDNTRLTREGLVVGTPDIMSPEQLTGSPIDHRSDLFALGVVCYELLAGVLPFDGSPLEIARQNLSCPPPPIAERRPGLAVAPELEEIAMRLMAKQPDDRFQSAKEVARAVTVAMASMQGRAVPSSILFGSDEVLPIEAAPRVGGARAPGWRHAVIGASAVAIAGVVVGLALASNSRGRERPEMADRQDLRAASDVAAALETPTASAMDAGVAERELDASTDAAPDAASRLREGVGARRGGKERVKRPPKPPKEQDDIYDTRY